MRRSKLIVGVRGDVVPQVAMRDLHQPRKARPGVHASRERLAFRRPSNVVSLLRSGRTTRPKQRTAPRQTWSGTSSNVNVAGASRLSVRVLPSRVPVERRGPSRHPPPERCHRSGRAPAEQRRRRRPSSEPYPEIAAPCGVATRGLRAACVPASLELATRRGVRP
jgi:hypothetical protein